MALNKQLMERSGGEKMVVNASGESEGFSLCAFLKQLDFLRILTKLKTVSIQQAVTIMMELGKDSGRDRHG